MKAPTWLRLQSEIDFHLATMRVASPAKSAMDQLVDQATGYDKQLREGMIEKLKRLRTLWRRWGIVTGDDMTEFIEMTSETIDRISKGIK